MESDRAKRTAHLLAPIAQLYALRLRECGATARGVYWRNSEGQQLRFEVLMGVVDLKDDKGGVTVNDLGCGYGAFFEFLAGLPVMKNSRYIGYDISEEMVREAARRIRDPRATFVESMLATHMADYSFVSGTYNMKLDERDRDWSAYVEESLRDLWSVTRKGLAFNMLAANPGKRKERDLYYADWRIYRDFCIQELSPDVTVVRDYPLDEWTIYVHRRR